MWLYNEGLMSVVLKRTNPPQLDNEIIIKTQYSVNNHVSGFAFGSP